MKESHRHFQKMTRRSLLLVDCAIETEGHTMPEADVGYKRPPQHSRFKKGHSGNPKGRPKRKSMQMSEIHAAFLREPIECWERGKRKTATRLELGIRRLVAAAVKGDIESAKSLLELYQHAERHVESDTIVIEV